MAQDTIREGGCLCGAVRFAARGEPINVRICHCRLCQRAMAGPYFARALYAASQVTVSGVTARYPSSPQLDRLFCPRCGTRVMADRRGAERVAIALAALDDPGALSPECHMFVDFKLPWEVIADGLPQYPEWAP